eukprot:CAMPEP_0113666572 /NCGR_PEP_ID=MMETSP0038_2-20120614/2954_1 /TAXON_ID=2898 /ORGANISM="Cryptomonas paramecium" /LENGTH=263 /DNA_ID=CAMNT_0000582089 /DNA_START=34 /DNA_END=822 /DNA_ORIENTATION=+ /assembly_acc=CAM_ASM_000170
MLKAEALYELGGACEPLGACLQPEVLEYWENLSSELLTLEAPRFDDVLDSVAESVGDNFISCLNCTGNDILHVQEFVHESSSDVYPEPSRKLQRTQSPVAVLYCNVLLESSENDDTIASNDSEGTNHSRGRKRKADCGVAPKPWEGNRDWAARRVNHEEKYKLKFGSSKPLPWNDISHCMTARATGNQQKVLFMDISFLEDEGIVEVERVDNLSYGFFGIHRIVVPADKRNLFDGSEYVASIDRARREQGASSPDAKRLTKMW